MPTDANANANAEGVQRGTKKETLRQSQPSTFFFGTDYTEHTEICDIRVIRA